MKYINFIKFVILVSFICFFTAVITTGCTANSSTLPSKTGQNDLDSDKLVDDYIGRNYSSVDIQSDNINNQLGIIDDDLEKHDIFFTGEFHAIAMNYELQLMFLKYFNQMAGVRYLLSEIGYSSGAYINRYLQTGDEENLRIIFDNLKGTAAWSMENYNFYKKLREYNLTLPENKRIIVVGVDIEHQVATALKYLYSLLQAETPPEEIKSTVEKFRNLRGKSEDSDEIKNIITAFQRDIESNEEYYRNYIAGDFFDFSIVVDNIINSFNAYEDEDKFDSIREKCIWDNFQRVYDFYPRGKYYGQWGMEHIYQRTCNTYMGSQDRFAMYINSWEKLKDRVLSIAYGYENCFYTANQAGYKKAKAGSSFVDQGYIAKYAKTDITILKLNGENSPFNSRIYFVSSPLGGVTTDYFQYFVLIKNSNGTTPYGPVQ